MPQWSDCPVCDQTVNGPIWLEMPPLSWRNCQRCGLVFKAEEPDGFLTDDHYEDSYFTGGSRKYDRRREHRIGKAARQLSAGQEFTSGRRLLDIGCSLGYALEAGRRRGPRRQRRGQHRGVRGAGPHHPRQLLRLDSG